MIFRRALLFAALFAFFCTFIPSANTHYAVPLLSTVSMETETPAETAEEAEEPADMETQEADRSWLSVRVKNAYIAPVAHNDGGDPARRLSIAALPTDPPPNPRRLDVEAIGRTDAQGNPILGSTYMHSMAYVFPLESLPT